jgi:aspartate/methionine/tyrosine aminotransferase
VLLTASSSEAYSFLLALLCDPGASIAVPRPSYPLFDSLVQLSCVHLAGYPLAYDGSWGIDLDALESSIDERHRAIFLVTPNNPTGSIVTRTELAQLDRIAREHDLALVSDEVFCDYILTDRPDRVRCLASDETRLDYRGWTEALA